MRDEEEVGLEAAIVHLSRWASTAKAEAAADSRVQQRWAQTQAEDEATLASVLAGLAERRAVVAAHTRTGSTIRGAVAGVGADYLAVARGSQLTLLPLAALDWVRPDGPAAPAAFADRTESRGLLVGVLAGMAAEATTLRIVSGEEILVGELVAVGADVLTVRPTGAPASQLVYVPVASLSEASLRLSG